MQAGLDRLWLFHHSYNDIDYPHLPPASQACQQSYGGTPPRDLRLARWMEVPGPVPNAVRERLSAS